MKAYRIAAALLSLGLAASGISPAFAQSTPRARLLTRMPGALLSHRGPMTITTMMPSAQLHAIPEQGTLQQQLIGPATVTSVRGSILTFRMHSGAMAAIQIPATSMRAMRLTTGTRLRFLMLNSRQFKMFVTGGRLAPCVVRCVPQRPSQ